MLYGIALLDAASHGDDADVDGVPVLSPRLHFIHHRQRVWTSACLSGWSMACLVQQKRFALAASSANGTRQTLCFIADGSATDYRCRYRSLYG